MKQSSTETLIGFLEAAELQNGPGAVVNFRVGESTGFGVGVIKTLRTRGYSVTPNPRGGWVLARG